MKITNRLILLFLLALNSYCFSQNQYAQSKFLDSLNNELNNKNIHDTSLIKTLALIGESTPIFRENYWDSISSLADELIKKNNNDLIVNRILKTKALAVNNIGFVNHMKGNKTEALDYYKKALIIREKINDIPEIVNSLKNIGGIYHDNQNYPKAFEYFSKSLKFSKEINDLKNVASIYSILGNISYNQGKIEAALNYHHKALKIAKQINNELAIANSFNSISALYEEQKDFLSAINFAEKSLKYYKSVNAKRGVSAALNNIGYLYFTYGDPSIESKQASITAGLKKSISYFNKALVIDKETQDNRDYMKTLLNLGHYHKKLYERNPTIDSLLDISKQNFEQALVIAEQLKRKDDITYALRSLASIYLLKNQINLAKNYAKKSLEIAENINYPSDILSAASILSDIYLKNDNFKDALTMYKLYIQMRDSLNNEATQKATAQQQAKYEYEKQKAIDDAEHEKQLAIEKEAKAKQQILTYATAGGLGLVGIFLIFVFNRLQVTRKQKNIIEEQKQEVEHQKETVEQAHTQLAEKNKEITDSIQYAKRIQSAILPPNKLVKEYLQESFILYKPKDIVAGDFYWMEHKDNKVLFAAADCTGHGVPGAMVSVVCNNGLNRSVREYGLTDPGKILDKTREIVIQEFEKSEEEVKDGMDIALCSLTGNTLQYAGAHNPLWIIRPVTSSADKQYELIEIKANKQPIGKFDKPEPYTTHTLELQKGDTVYIFSDGYVDQFGGEKGKKFKAANFRRLLLSIQQKNMQQQKELIDAAFETWRGSLEQLDDVCVIGVRI